jgi:hypothetical protein
MGTRRAHLVIGLSLVAFLTAGIALSVSRITQDASAQGTPALALDMDVTNGSGPCDPVDNVGAINSGDTYQIAVCLSNSPSPPAAFQFDLKYNDDLNQCVPVDCAGTTCLDGNPDANVGSTTFAGTDLGAGWDCNIMQVQGPACDRDPGSGATHGDALMVCMTVEENLTLKVGDGVSSPIAMVNFKSVGDGSDTMTLENVEVDDVNVEKIVDPIFGNGMVIGGSISTEGVPPTLTPAPGETTAAGETPAGGSTPSADAGPAATAAAATAIAQGTPVEALDQAATATTVAVATKSASAAKTATAKPGSTGSTGEESDGSSGPSVLLIVGIVIVAGIVVGGGGWFGYRRFRAR